MVGKTKDSKVLKPTKKGRLPLIVLILLIAIYVFAIAGMILKDYQANKTIENLEGQLQLIKREKDQLQEKRQQYYWYGNYIANSDKIIELLEKSKKIHKF